jgi:hypothetical protein
MELGTNRLYLVQETCGSLFGYMQAKIWNEFRESLHVLSA